MVIVGVPPDSAEERWLSAQLRSAQADNVLTVPQVPLADVATYLYAADCLVIPPTDEPLRSYGRTVLPMKVFSYLAAGRPILAPRLPDIEEVLRDGDSALLVAPGNPAAAGAAARRILEDDVLAARLSKGARDSARAFTWSARAGTIVTTLERWLARSV
jgi:glycosyltransferase involved in cell wall biosynthesis